jgi:hypothetical protein
MKKFTTRSLLAFGIVATLGLSTPIAASAGVVNRTSDSSQRTYGDIPHKSPGTGANKTYRQELAAYNASRLAIENAFHLAVSNARVAFSSALATATTSAQRSAARQVMLAAVIQAAATRSSALAALGSPPVKPS